jgi:hypothetical protein
MHLIGKWKIFSYFIFIFIFIRWMEVVSSATTSLAMIADD